MAKKAYIGVNNFTQRTLPSGYTQIEYIESAGTQYIDTGFRPNQDTRVVADMWLLKNNTAVAANEFFGARTSASSKVFAVQWNEDRGYIQQFYGNGYTEMTTSFSKERQIFDCDKNVFTSKDVTNTRTYETFQCDYTLYYFALNNAGATSFSSCCRLYSSQIYDNGTLIRDYVPCINPSGAIGLYDLVNGQFYGNAGTGTFVAGGTYKSVARKIKKGYIGVDNFTQRVLPAGYTQIEYIESSGTQYINTNFYPKYNSRVVMDVSDVPNGYSYLFGSRDTNLATSPRQFGFYRSNPTSIRVDYFGSNKSHTVADSTVRTVVDMDANIIKAYEQTVIATAVASGECSYPLYLFALNDSNTRPLQHATATLHSCQIYDNGTLVRDYIPCINPSGAIGLYDLVHGQFYGNAGTGTFIAGGTYKNVARKIKKAYIGIGGMARPCWSGEGIEYYGTISGVHLAASSMGTGTIGNYALFGGGENSSNNRTYKDGCSYNKSLTKSNMSSFFTEIRSRVSSATIGDYALFLGGRDQWENYKVYNRLTSYNKSLTRSEKSTSFTAHSIAATTVGGYAIFGGGFTGDGSYIGYYTNKTLAFDNSLTVSTPTVLSVSRAELAAATAGNYALFGGGHSGSTSNHSSSAVVDAYDASLTRTTPTALSVARDELQAVTIGNYALFAGGYASQTAKNTVEVYNQSLTRTSITSLTQATGNLNGVTINPYGLFLLLDLNKVDYYDQSLTKTNIRGLKVKKSAVCAATVDKYVIFGGGYDNSQGAHVATAEAYTIS